jgi:hypothetical protein
MPNACAHVLSNSALMVFQHKQLQQRQQRGRTNGVHKPHANDLQFSDHQGDRQRFVAQEHMSDNSCTTQGFMCMPWLSGQKGTFLRDMHAWLRDGKVARAFF